MAKANVSLLLSIFVIASLSSLSHGLAINGLQIGSIAVTGVLRCNLNGTQIGPPIPGQTVVLRCAGSTTSLAQAITDPAGAIRIVVSILDTALFDPATCLATVALPVANCSVFPPDGFLASTVSLVNVLQTSVVNIANFITGSFLVL